MKNVVIVACLSFAFTASLALAGHGPEMVNLKAAYQIEGKKRAVIFPHHRHQERAKCGKCHKSTMGGGPLVVDLVQLAGLSNDFHKKFCWPCHVERKVPKGTSCKTCHR